jgi:hypothetical protein
MTAIVRSMKSSLKKEHTVHCVFPTPIQEGWYSLITANLNFMNGDLLMDRTRRVKQEKSKTMNGSVLNVNESTLNHGDMNALVVSLRKTWTTSSKR